MKESTKGVLLSALVYPGLGQLILGQVAAGVVFIILTTTALLVFIYRIIERAARSIDEILPLMAKNELDVNVLKELLSQDPHGGWGVEAISLIALAGCWLVAIMHAYFAGRKIDLK